MKYGLLGKQRGLGSWGQRGQALVEFALVSVLFFILSFGVFDMARLFQSWVSVQHASREAARYAITGLTTCDGASGRDACIIWEAEHATGGLARAGEGGSDITVQTRAWDYDCLPSGGCSWPDPAVADATGKQCDQIEVIVAYKHKFVLPVLSAAIPGGITVVGRQRMTNEPYATCEDADGVSGVSGSVTPSPTSTAGPTTTPVTPTATPVAPTATKTPTPSNRDEDANGHADQDADADTYQDAHADAYQNRHTGATDAHADTLHAALGKKMSVGRRGADGTRAQVY